MLYAVVMAGGSGTRFWPKSRRSRPKQLLNLHGDATMLQQTVARIAPMVAPAQTLIVTGADQAEAVRAQLPELPAENIIAEPCPRDTAPCVGLAATIIARRDPESTMVVMPADHVIEPASVYRQTVQVALDLINSDPSAFVTFGVRPTRPETGYGYIECGPEVGRYEGIRVNKVSRFKEKPPLEVAREFLAQGNYVWNAGIFFWRTRAILEEIARHKPELAAGLQRIGEALGTPEAAEVLNREFGQLERVPIDKAVMEKAPNVRVLEVTYDWSDVGDWRSLATLVPPDAHGNSTRGPVLSVDTSSSIILSEDGQLIATLGVEDLVIVQSGGATLVAHKDKLDQLKSLVEGLEAAGFGEYL
ncbi:MAG: mannose-1-phosphate guanylyltransferase [Isosphaeraceae bacterium]